MLARLCQRFMPDQGNNAGGGTDFGWLPDTLYRFISAGLLYVLFCFSSSLTPILRTMFCGTKGIGKQRPTTDGRPRPTVGSRTLNQDFDLQLGDSRDELERRLGFQLQLQFSILSFLFLFLNQNLSCSVFADIMTTMLDYRRWGELDTSLVSNGHIIQRLWLNM
ncbi:hypothetical protein M9H77_35258 [Catharanthus roseus]|uniref:Uncharacterized protein n=1 Tax=Catharanthus roseus TaxID=4058 RepID=A0ACB9ZQE0_CATRO|nr:hypothetical protein M9H77_35258 [Catharanthus roseus]